MFDTGEKARYTSFVVEKGEPLEEFLDGKGVPPMWARTIAVLLLAYFSTSAEMALAEEAGFVASSPRIDSLRADWTVFDSSRPVSPGPTKEEITEKKKEFSFKVAETAQEISDSLKIPLLPRLIEGGNRMVREVYRLKKDVNRRHIHVDVSRDSAEVKFRFRF